MSEQKTEQASAARKKKAQDNGDRVKSRELLSAVAMLSGVVVLGAMVKSFVGGWRGVYVGSLRGALAPDGGVGWMGAMHRMLGPALLPIGSVMAACFTGALVAGMAQNGGLQIHPNALELKFERLNPVTNLGNLFGLKSATRLVKSLIPAGIVVWLGSAALGRLLVPMPVMSLERVPGAFEAAYGLALDAAFVTLGWSALDYAIEWVSWNRRLKMSKQELRDEHKESQGNPQVKSRVRQAQNVMRRRRVKADLSRASVVITNPTHYAVALEFSFETMQAPLVLAKGRDLLAAEIREQARWLGVPLIENPPLARSLYAAVEPGQTIPFELYQAVAGILAFLYRERVEERMRREREREAKARADQQASTPLKLAAIRIEQFGGGM